MTGQTIGIVGGGQLGRMLTLAAKPLGFHVVVVDPNPGCPASQVGAEEITANLYDHQALKELAKRADHITVEIEHLDADALESIAGLGKPVHPSPSTIRLIQDKFRQKVFLRDKGIPLAPFEIIEDDNGAMQALRRFKKMLLKTRHGAYDGRGNMVVRNQKELRSALERFAGAKLYAEAFVPFQKELAVMIARGTDGSVSVYPVVETIHTRNICDQVLVPAPVDDAVHRAARRLALKVAGHLEGAGVYGIEMFWGKDGRVMINEIAPRVHNSGHYTTEACVTSQFEQHIRAVTGLPLGKTDLLVPAAVMINILGERDGPTKVEGLHQALKVPHTSVHLYGKGPTKIDRKMGHITALGKTIGEAKKRAKLARKKVSL